MCQTSISKLSANLRAISIAAICLFCIVCVCVFFLRKAKHKTPSLSPFVFNFISMNSQSGENCSAKAHTHSRVLALRASSNLRTVFLLQPFEIKCEFFLFFFSFGHLAYQENVKPKSQTHTYTHIYPGRKQYSNEIENFKLSSRP